MGRTIWTVINLFIYSSIKYPYYLKQQIDCKTKNFQKNVIIGGIILMKNLINLQQEKTYFKLMTDKNGFRENTRSIAS